MNKKSNFTTKACKTSSSILSISSEGKDLLDEDFVDEDEATYLLNVPSDLSKKIGNVRQSLRFANQLKIKAQQQESLKVE